jgi:GTPase
MEQEIEEGNIEYKRCLKSNIRCDEYISQMLWRIKEGNGEATYYLGINDNGSIYKWTDDERIETISIIRKIVKKANLKIVKMEKKYYDTSHYLKVTIREKTKIIPEKRILLLGPSGVGKTTFLANIILSKVDEDNKEARMYLFNHKHEFIQKKTSSFNYNYLIYNDVKYVFIEAPGYNKYYKTRNKIIESFGSSIDCCIFIEKDIWLEKNAYVEYFNILKIPHINLNLYSNEHHFPNYNGQHLIDKNDFFNNLIFKNTKNSLATEFVVLQSYKMNDIILIGILKKGTLIENKKYYFHHNNISTEIIIKSIYLDDKPISKICGPRTISISINDIQLKNYNGIINTIK